ncbi:hypothetical protein CR205_14720 [Alteribacter lacisalsi]|uniref:DUF2788 domain-containing protein n=1 Tax=Alteribacter lacisalsi TaxID=2045244 RepID=A0A2W0H517_9BACI|nr:hypothetical protein [Alteribacter lacisalsi]PYZ96924.1 hypothetical protein CR205_14720 [Alteribacter lacisalsi]
MEVAALASLYSIAIIVIMVVSIIKVFGIAKSRGDITRKKFVFLVTALAAVGGIVVFLLPDGYALLFDKYLSDFE